MVRVILNTYHTLIMGILTLHLRVFLRSDIRLMCIPLLLALVVFLHQRSIHVIQGMEVTSMVWEHFLPEVLQQWQLHMVLTTCLIMGTGHMVMATMVITTTMASLNTISSSAQSLANAGSMEGCLGSTKCGSDSCSCYVCI